MKTAPVGAAKSGAHFDAAGECLWPYDIPRRRKNSEGSVCAAAMGRSHGVGRTWPRPGIFARGGKRMQVQ
jgi:hypothetical protein